MTISDLFLLLLLLLAMHSQSNAENQIEKMQMEAVNDLLRDANHQRGRTAACENDFVSCGYCNNKTNICSVTSIDLSGWNIEGTISPSIANLSKLERLDLMYNSYQGVLPESFGKLTNLAYVYLDYNKLEGPIPLYFGNMKSLLTLSLTGNKFSGKIPPGLGQLPYLERLYLDVNFLKGEIPKQICNITSLQILWLSDNLLTGELPSQLGNLTKIYKLYLDKNDFHGQIPPSFENLTNLQDFNIQGNNFNGNFPDIVFKWPSLYSLDLTGNNFVVPLPSKFPLKSLRALSVTDLNGAENTMFPDLKDLTQLQTLTLRNCSLNGPIPPYIWEIASLETLDLSFNHLTGMVPPTLNNASLRYIYLRRNELTGTLPVWQTLNTGGYVDVSQNNFSDINIADQIPLNNYNMNLFACCKNMKDPLPPRFQSIQGLLRDNFQCPDRKLMRNELYINCGGNSTTVNGSMLFEADMQQQGQSAFFVSKNKTWAYSIMEADPPYILSQTCNLSMESALVYQNARVAPTSLTYYAFCLKKNNYNVKLHFAELRPRSNRYFNVLIQGKLLLSNFNIKAEAGGVNMEVTREFPILLNRTRLEIHLYWTGKGKYGPLLSGISISPVPKDKKKLPRAVIAGIALSASSLIIAIILFVLWIFGCLGRKKHEPKRIEIYPGGSYTFEDIKVATNNFNDSNKIGEGGFGSVYKGILRNGMEIAVKKLSEKSRQGFREFMTEVGTISAMNHPHLVKLIGSLIEGSQHLLIYEYMRYNSLHDVLFGSHNVELRPILDWPRRVKMCLGIAKGLVYLHEEMKTPIVHRDITPTNILIDENLNAKISDFGYAKLYDEAVPSRVTRVIGTCGFMAPEQATRGIMTTKIDVYSFGVVTLMIISGRNNETNRSNDEATFLLDTACVLREENRLLDLVDPNLEGGYPRKEATTILELALLCANQSPSLRPKMSEALQILEGKRKLRSLSKVNETGGPSAVASNQDNNNSAQIAIDDEYDAGRE